MSRRPITDVEISDHLSGDADGIFVEEGQATGGREAWMPVRQVGGPTADSLIRSREAGLSVRALAPQDHQAIHEILASRAVIEGTMRLPHAALRETVDRLSPRPGTFHLVADVGGRPVGVLELVTWPDEPRHRHVGEVNLVAVHPDSAGRGAGRALMEAAVELADDWLNLRRLSLVVFVDNEVARNLYRRLGFVVEGTMVDYGFKRGRYVAAQVMARLRDDPQRSSH